MKVTTFVSNEVELNGYIRDMYHNAASLFQKGQNVEKIREFLFQNEISLEGISYTVQINSIEKKTDGTIRASYILSSLRQEDFSFEEKTLEELPF